MHHRKKPPSLYIITARTNDPIKTANPDIFEIFTFACLKIFPRSFASSIPLSVKHVAL